MNMPQQEDFIHESFTNVAGCVKYINAVMKGGAEAPRRLKPALH
jgi:hypothetical protein